MSAAPAAFLPLTRDAVAPVITALRQSDRDEIDALLPGWDEPTITAGFLAAPVGAVMTWHGAPCVAMAAVERWRGNWEVAALATDRWRGRAVAAATEHIHATIIPDLLARGMRRATCRSIHDHVHAHDWLERWIGFTREAELRDWGVGGELFIQFVWRP